jgi:lysozyme
MPDPTILQGLAAGIDVSEDQGTVDWAAVAAAGTSFVFIKATDGEDYLDPRFTENWAGAKAAGLRRGAYHFFRAEDSPQTQAQWFWQNVGADYEIALVADVEESMGQSAATVTANLQAFLTALEALMGGGQPMIYTAPDFWNGLGTSAFGGYPLWVAEYGVGQPNLPTGWPVWQFWQYSESGSIAGVSGSVDLNVYAASPADLQQAFPSKT